MTFATTPLLFLRQILVVSYTNVAVILECVLSSVADAMFVGSVLVTNDLVPEAEEAVKVEVLDNLWILAATWLDGGVGETNES